MDEFYLPSTFLYWNFLQVPGTELHIIFVCRIKGPTEEQGRNRTTAKPTQATHCLGRHVEAMWPLAGHFVILCPELMDKRAWGLPIMGIQAHR
jgi:hypothetical protein